MKPISSKPGFTVEQYLELLNLTYEVIQCLKGKRVQDSRWPDCQQLATKLFFHAATIYWLMQGTKAPVPRSGRGAFFYDFASMAVLVRSTIETYLTMFEVFFEPKTKDEFEFNHALWLLSGFAIREDFNTMDPDFQNVVTNAQSEIVKMRDRIQKTAKFKSLKRGDQKDVLEGKRKRVWRNIAKSAGFGEQTIRLIYRYFSGYIHADGLSGTQIVSARTKKDQINFMHSQMSVIMMVLSKTILTYAAKFPEAKQVCDQSVDTYRLARVFSGAAALLP